MGTRILLEMRGSRIVSAVCLGLALLGCSAQRTEAANSNRRLKPKASAAIRRSTGAPVPNTILIDSKTTDKRPFTISRVFAMGEVPHVAQAVFNGQGLPTQCDVRTRWPDGSLQHAMISFWLTPAEGTNEVSFIDQETPSPEEALTAEGMLSADYDFGATMELTANGQSVEADARKMIQAGAFRYWLRGPICTQVIIEDRSDKFEFDLGWEGRKPFHPMFVATFYPGWRGVKVDWIGEVAWTNVLEDLTYSMVLKASGPDGTKVIYEKQDYTHFLSTRWRKSGWSGPELPAAPVDLNFAYMIYSRLLPSYDLSKSVPSSAVEDSYQTFLKSDRGELGGSALWVKYFPTTGGRSDIGLFPAWYVQYLYTFDPRLEEMMTAMANLSGSVPIHFRESTDRKFLTDSDSSGLGRVLSVEARESFWVGNLTYNQTKPNDLVVFTGARKESGWTPDLAHQPSMVFLPYILSGDYYLLEELQFWAAYNVAEANFGDCWYCRHFGWGYINTQSRGNAWGLRTLAHAAFATPDGTPEKTYFMDKVYRNIAVREGIADERQGAFYDEAPDSPWSFGRRVIALDKPNPLHFMDVNNDSSQPRPDTFNVDPNSPDRVTRANAPWQYSFMHVVLGHLDELGFPAGPLRRTLGTHLVRQLTDPVCNPYLVAKYVNPVYGGDGSFYTNWQSFSNGWLPEIFAVRSWPEKDDSDVEHGYPHISRAAASFLTDVCDGEFCGTQAWQWIDKNVGHQDKLKANPKWAFVPRGNQSSEVLQAFSRSRVQQFKPKAVAIAKKKKK